MCPATFLSLFSFQFFKQSFAVLFNVYAATYDDKECCNKECGCNNAPEYHCHCSCHYYKTCQLCRYECACFHNPVSFEIPMNESVILSCFFACCKYGTVYEPAAAKECYTANFLFALRNIVVVELNGIAIAYSNSHSLLKKRFYIYLPHILLFN